MSRDTMAFCWHQFVWHSVLMLDVQTANEEQPEEGTCVIISWILSQGATLGLKKKNQPTSASASKWVHRHLESKDPRIVGYWENFLECFREEWKTPLVNSSLRNEFVNTDNSSQIMASKVNLATHLSYKIFFFQPFLTLTPEN